jgi:hypothetical protein
MILPECSHRFTEVLFPYSPARQKTRLQPTDQGLKSFSTAEYSHDRYGNDFRAMEGGISF